MRKVVYTMFLTNVSFHLRWKKICSSIKLSQNIMNMVVKRALKLTQSILSVTSDMKKGEELLTRNNRFISESTITWISWQCLDIINTARWLTLVVDLAFRFVLLSLVLQFNKKGKISHDLIKGEVIKMTTSWTKSNCLFVF